MVDSNYYWIQFKPKCDLPQGLKTFVNARTYYTLHPRDEILMFYLLDLKAKVHIKQACKSTSAEESLGYLLAEILIKVDSNVKLRTITNYFFKI